MQEPLPACSSAYGKALVVSSWQQATGSKQVEASSLQQAARSMQYLVPKLPRFWLIVGFSGMVLTNNKHYSTSNTQQATSNQQQ
jgi:hypothetical protein